MLTRIGTFQTGLLFAAFSFAGCGMRAVTEQSRAARDLPSAVAEYRKLGLPWTIADLKVPAPSGDADDAAPYLASARSVAQAYDLPAPDAKPPTKRKRRPSRQDVFNRLKPFLMAASTRHLNLSKFSIMGLAPDPRAISACGEFIDRTCAAAELAAKENHIREAAWDLKVASRLTDLAWNDGFSVSCSMYRRNVADVCRAAEACAAHFHSDASDLARLRSALSLQERPLNLARILRTEAILELETARHYRCNHNPATKDPNAFVLQPNSDPMSSSADGFPPAEEDRASMDRVVRFWDHAFPAAKRLSAQPVKAAAAFDRVAATTLRSSDSSYLLLNYMRARISRAAEQILKAQAQIRSLKALLKSRTTGVPL